MVPIKPISLKAPPEIRERIVSNADTLGYSANKFMVQSLVAIMDMIEKGDPVLPGIVVLVRTARKLRAKTLPPAEPQRQPKRANAVACAKLPAFIFPKRLFRK